MGSVSRNKHFKQEKQATTSTNFSNQSEQVCFHATENFLNESAINTKNDEAVEFHVSKPTALNAVVVLELETSSDLNKI